MSFLSEIEVANLGLASCGNNVKISSKASIYNPEKIKIGNNSRIDDFCVLSGNIQLGKNVHLAVGCNLAGGDLGIKIQDFAGLAYGVQVFTKVDDYSGLTLSNPTIPTAFRLTHERSILIGSHCKIGTYSIVLPGSILNVGGSFSAQSLISGETKAHTLYSGNPLREISVLSKKLLEVEDEYERFIAMSKLPHNLTAENQE